MRKKEIVGCVSCSILHEDSLLFCMINRTITVGMIDDYYESLNYYFIARQKETVAHTRCSVRLHSLAKTLLSSRRHSLQTHTHTHTRSCTSFLTYAYVPHGDYTWPLAHHCLLILRVNRKLSAVDSHHRELCSLRLSTMLHLS